MPARIIDANANRAREALRVLEDAARFALEDAALTAVLKEIRHGLQGALAVLPPGWLEANRDTAHDPGRDIEGTHEMVRADHHAVVAAAGKRLGEALRSIEECLKTVPGGNASAVEQLRYRAYEAEARLLLRMGSARARQWRLCVLLTEALCARPWRQVLEAVIEAGADAVQVREKELSTRELASRVRVVVEAAHGGRAARAGGSTPSVPSAAPPVAVVVNDRMDVALACGADGVHLGTDDMAITDARRLAGTGLIIGASTHSLSEAAAAVEAGADYCGVGAMFGTGTKRGAPVQGAEYLRAFLVRFPRTPHLAIGGVTPENAPVLVQAGARGLAVSAAVCSAADPGQAVRALLEVVAEHAVA